jgi:hypothetical protein
MLWYNLNIRASERRTRSNAICPSPAFQARNTEVNADPVRPGPSAVVYLACGQTNGFLDEVAYAPIHDDFFQPSVRSRCRV